jgi:hypothetical protein
MLLRGCALMAVAVGVALAGTTWASGQTSEAAQTEFRIFLPRVTSPPTANLYLFVERWLTSDLGPGCQPTHVDGPVYGFAPASGRLHVWNEETPRLEETDLGYYGAGIQLSGMGSGGGSGLTRIVNLTFKQDDVEIVSADQWGTIAIRLGAETIDLAPGSERRWQTVESDDPPCVITTTHRISNFGFQDRAKIEYH